MDSNRKKLGVGALTALVVGSMVGGGIFSIPQNTAASAGVGATALAWGLDAVGDSSPLPSRFMTFDRSDLSTLAAINHAGVAIGREQLVRKRVQDGELVLPFGGFREAFNYGYYLVHPAHETLPRRLKALIDWLVEQADN